jgi:hypothetical protein
VVVSAPCLSGIGFVIFGAEIVMIVGLAVGRVVRSYKDIDSVVGATMRWLDGVPVMK